MKRFSVLSLSAVLALGVASISDSSFAQQRVTRDQLVGMWTIVSCTDANGATPAQCVNPNGRMMLNATGQYMYTIAPRGRPKCSTGACGAQQMSGDQWKAATQGVVSDFGNWSFNDADQTLTRFHEASLNPNNEGSQFKNKVSLTGDDLRTVNDGGGTQNWRRVR